MSARQTPLDNKLYRNARPNTARPNNAQANPLNIKTSRS